MTDHSKHSFISFSSFSEATTFEIEENFFTSGCPTGCNCYTLDLAMFSFHFNMYFWSAEWCACSAAQRPGVCFSIHSRPCLLLRAPITLQRQTETGKIHAATTQQHSGVTKTKASPSGQQRGAICSRFKDFRLSEEFYSTSTLHIHRDDAALLQSRPHIQTQKQSGAHRRTGRTVPRAFPRLLRSLARQRDAGGSSPFLDRCIFSAFAATRQHANDPQDMKGHTYACIHLY